MQRLTGYLLIGIGIVHTVYGVLKGWERLVEIAQAGFFNAIEPHLPRRVLFWFLFAGFFMILLGHLCLWVERRLGQRVPAFVGWELVALSALGAILVPAPGFFFLLGIGIYIVAVARGGTPTGETVP